MMKREMLMAVLALTCMTVPAQARPTRAAAPAAPVSDSGGWTMYPPNPTAYDRAPWWMNQSVITQTGFVFAELPANRASFTATFLTNADTVEKAQAKAIDKTRALNQALDRLGKDAVRITTAFTMRALYQEYRDKDGNRIEDRRADKINGYEVSLNLNLEVRDMAVVEKAYALVLAASPSSAGNIYFSLQPTNAQNSWLYTEAVKDAHARAIASAEAAGARLGPVRVIDPTGRACDTDILARDKSGEGDNTPANEVMVSGQRAYKAEPAMMAPPPPPPPPPGSPEALEAQALKNPFIQTPPLERTDARACVVYGLQ